jgi:hypothetical protein
VVSAALAVTADNMPLTIPTKPSKTTKSLRAYGLGMSFGVISVYFILTSLHLNNEVCVADLINSVQAALMLDIAHNCADLVVDIDFAHDGSAATKPVHDMDI